MEDVYERVWRRRPGWSRRDAGWWSYTLGGPAALRRGAASNVVIHETETGEVNGYALWRSTGSWDSRGPTGTVYLEELVTDLPTAYVALWRFLLEMDLTRSVRYDFGAPDESLLWLVDEPRQMGATVADGIFLRLVDVPVALSARRYSVPVDLIIELTDNLLNRNEGRWRLTGDHSGAVCEPTSDAVDLRCDIGDLSAAYLGGTSLGALWCAGRVEEIRPGAVDVANAALGWSRKPNGIEMF